MSLEDVADQRGSGMANSGCTQPLDEPGQPFTKCRDADIDGVGERLTAACAFPAALRTRRGADEDGRTRRRSFYGAQSTRRLGNLDVRVQQRGQQTPLSSSDDFRLMDGDERAVGTT